MTHQDDSKTEAVNKRCLDELSRRSVLRKGAVASGTALVGGVALVGEASAGPRRNYVYVDDTLDPDDTVTLGERLGRGRVDCGPSNIKTEVFATTDADTDVYAIPSGWDTGDTLMLTDFFSHDCEGNDLQEVSVSLVTD